MGKIASFIVHKKYLFAALFAALTIFSIFSFSWAHVEADISAYLAEDSDTKRGLVAMEEFTTYEQRSLIVHDMDENEAETYARKLEALEGVFSVAHQSVDRGDRIDAQFDIVFNGPADNSDVADALASMEELFGPKEYTVLAGEEIDYAGILVTQMSTVLVLVVIIVVGVLLLTSTTYAEIPVLLLTFLVAAVINMGTNFLMGTISFVSNAVAVVLQLALSVDYAIILCNRYKEEHLTKPIEEAAISALTFSIPSISASSLTTIAGLAAMTFMKFSLGMDMGIALIKAIFLSLATVFLFMPFLLVVFGKWMDKSGHRSFVPKIDPVGRFAYKSRFVLPILFVGVVIAACVGFNRVQYDFTSDEVRVINETPERQEQREVQEITGTTTVIALIVPTGDYPKEAQLIGKIEAMPEVDSVLAVANIEAVDGYRLGDEIVYTDFMKIANVDEMTAKALFAYYAADAGETEKAMADLDHYQVSIIDLFVELHDISQSGVMELGEEETAMINDLYSQLSMALDQLKGENYSRMVVNAALPVQGEETFAFIRQLKTMVQEEYGDDVYITGNAVSAKDFAETFEVDTKTVTTFSIVMVMLILLLTFKTPVMPILMILVIQGSIWLNFAVAHWTGSTVFFMCYLIVSSIQMGANIDYAIVISTRYTEMRDQGLAPREAIIRTMNLAFPTIITSGTMMVVAGLLIGFRISEPVVGSMGYYVGTGTIITLVLVNFVLPQLLLLGDKPVRATILRTDSGSKNGKYLRLASGVTALAVAALIGVSSFGLQAEIQEQKDSALGEYEAMEQTVDRLDELEAALSDADMSDTQYAFAEAVVTENIGRAQLADGEAQYEAGVDALAYAKNMVDTNEEAYREGLAQYQDALSQYEDAKKQLADGEKQLKEAEPIISVVSPFYESYQNTQQEFRSAIYSYNGVKAAILAPKLLTDTMVFENKWPIVNESLGGLVEQYNDGKEQLEEGKAQFAEATVQIEDGEEQLTSARTQLDDAHAQIADGEAQLAAAKAELDSGRALLEENQVKLQESAKTLEEHADQSNEYSSGLRSLLRLKEIRSAVTDSSDYAAVSVAARDYVREGRSDAEQKAMLRTASLIASCVASALAVIAVIIGFALKKRRASICLSGLSAAAAVVSVVLCGFTATVKSVFCLLAALLCLTTVVFAVWQNRAQAE